VITYKGSKNAHDNTCMLLSNLFTCQATCPGSLWSNIQCP